MQIIAIADAVAFVLTTAFGFYLVRLSLQKRTLPLYLLSALAVIYTYCHTVLYVKSLQPAAAFRYPIIFSTAQGIRFWFPPIFMMLIQSLLNIKLKSIDIFKHLSVGFFYTLYYVLLVTLTPVENYKAVLLNLELNQLNVFEYTREVLRLVLLYAYFVYTIGMLIQYIFKQTEHNIFSHSSRFKRLLYLTLLPLVFHSIVLINCIVTECITNHYSPTLFLPGLMFIVYLLRVEPELFYQPDTKPRFVLAPVERMQTQKNVQSETTRNVDAKQVEDYQNIVNKVEELLAAEKLHLNHNLDIKLLSDRLQIPSYRLSKAINTVLNTHFNDFINSKRIAHTIEMLSKQDFENLSIEGIGIASGFKSKSVFYAAFRKHTGTTPTRFRQSLAPKMS